MYELNTYQNIVEIMKIYFDGLYHAESKILANVFHPDARYVNTVDGDYMNYSRREYFDIIEQRTSPASQGELCNDQILSIEFGGSHMAFVRAEMTMMGRQYIDFLTLTFDQNGWRIMSKVFTYSPQQGEI